jgi:hypothetical protein
MARIGALPRVRSIPAPGSAAELPSGAPGHGGAGSAQRISSGCIRAGSCCLPVLAFELAHIGAGLGWRFWARSREPQTRQWNPISWAPAAGGVDVETMLADVPGGSCRGRSSVLYECRDKIINGARSPVTRPVMGPAGSAAWPWWSRSAVGPCGRALHGPG